MNRFIVKQPWKDRVNRAAFSVWELGGSYIIINAIREFVLQGDLHVLLN